MIPPALVLIGKERWIVPVPLFVLWPLLPPALVLAWRGDPTHPLSSAERLCEALPRAELHVAHSLDDVRSWSGMIRAFLKRLGPLPSAVPALTPG